MHPFLTAFQSMPQVIYVADIKGDALFVHAFTGTTYKLGTTLERTGMLASEKVPSIGLTCAVTPAPGKADAATELLLTRDAAARLIKALQLEATRLAA